VLTPQYPHQPFKMHTKVESLRSQQRKEHGQPDTFRHSIASEGERAEKLPLG
jgi:hypothetical protein